MFIDNKYTKIYFNIIHNATQRVLTGYKENHHIVPKSLGGPNSADNIVALTAREHFICHRLLVKMTESTNKQKMAYAVRRMLTGISKNHKRDYIVSSKIYEIMRIENNKHLAGYTHSIETREKMSRSLKGRSFSNETLIKMSESRKGKPKPPHIADRLRTARLGAITSQETKNRISEALSGRIMSETHKSNLSKNHANVSGSNNPRAKTWEITSPEGIIYTISGEMGSFCKQHGLVTSTMRGIGRSGKTPASGKCAGWRVKILSS